VPDGSLLALVGANGSGKTTLLSAVLGQVDVVAGATGLDDAVMDLCSRAHLARVGYVPDEEPVVPPELTAQEFYALLGRVRDVGDAGASLERAAALAERLGHRPGRTPFGAFSHGMAKKTQLVAALMHEPDLVLVDELANGLDPISAVTADRLLDEARDRGAVVVVSTHDLAWVEQRADLVAVVHGGRVLAQGPVAQVRGRRGALSAAYEDLLR
jgi:ABC-2 type transport system ATP-binding protein